MRLFVRLGPKVGVRSLRTGAMREMHCWVGGVGESWWERVRVKDMNKLAETSSEPVGWTQS